MKTFKAKKAKNKYKNTDAWLNAIYRNNKDVIDKELGGTKLGAKRTFKKIVQEYMAEGLTPTKAVNALARSTTFTPKAERMLNNVWSGLKGDKAAYKEFRELTKEKGKYTKFDRDKMVWDKSQSLYVYAGVITISFKNSPYGIEVAHV